MSTLTETRMSPTALDEAILKGVGGSQGPTYRNGIGASGVFGLGSKPLQIKDLLANPVRFRKQAATVAASSNPANEIPYEPINDDQLGSQLSSTSAATAANASANDATAEPSSPESSRPASTSRPKRSDDDADEEETPSSSPRKKKRKKALVDKTEPTDQAEAAAAVAGKKKNSSSTGASPPQFFPAISTDATWSKSLKVGWGLQNLGNTCFLNSALQVMLHTPPLVRHLEATNHSTSTCKFLAAKKFCMTCALQNAIKISFYGSKRSYAPNFIVNNMRKIASHFRPGRQEDAHEFLRFSIDNMQLSALFGTPSTLDQPAKDSTFVHQIFGGRLRSRVTCEACGHASDTFDSVLDLSLDVNKTTSVKEALDRFIKTDSLRGANKYKCEKCRKLVNAEKGFTIDRAPMVLMIHLKRFTATGRKIGDTIRYPDQLQLGNYMSDVGLVRAHAFTICTAVADPHLCVRLLQRSTNPTYRLYGVINHSGGGPHSGHYTANVKAANGTWYDMNDETISSMGSSPPLHRRQAYILAYSREGTGPTERLSSSSSVRAPAPNGVASKKPGMTNGVGSPVRPTQSEAIARPRVLSNSGPRPPIVQTAKKPLLETVPPPPSAPRGIPFINPSTASPSSEAPEEEAPEEDDLDPIESDSEDAKKERRKQLRGPKYNTGARPGSGVFTNGPSPMSAPKNKKKVEGKLQINAMGTFGKSKGLVSKMKGKSGAGLMYGRPKLLRR
ncbi:BQ5605_C004g02594 [Microbotryum silenes-dioicae]|uniref:Ubiquitin carboxyl-terminal hydrolase n=1 Tax=Microbotryum silenes-dioicae TaxID=796604 RepID=A0A2X0N2D4_9BASI|nr:BQ5605_C004g02594 [Microbotryum silenes-dioicae]